MKMRKVTILLAPLAAIFVFSCGGSKLKKDIAEEADLRVKDPHSYADPTQAVVTHLDLEMAVDFEHKKLTGVATWDYIATDSALFIHFDTHNLNIEAVYNEMNGPIAFDLGPQDEVLGQSLKIGIGGHPKQINIKFSTTDSSDALQWLAPSQTAGKKSPFLYTQSEPILGRSWLPCQDSPGIRFTYKAKITTAPGYLAVMSAQKNPKEKTADGVYEFEQPNPIPSYLMALAVGDLEFKSTGPRTGVYAEPVTVEKAAWEFEETENMIETAEALYGPYIWGRYDILVLPPSFPYGGMENPNLTFATPTVIAGDRSLTSLIAHELAHSWSGNLVTNATWNDFWLNEGFTMYLERRLMEAIHDTSYSNMLACLGYGDLTYTLGDMYSVGDSADTKLKLDLAGRDPDLGMTDVAYEKGYLFLTKIEHVCGRKKFDKFLKDYFEKFKFKSLTTERFVKELYSGLIEKGGKEDQAINVNAWVFGAGLPSGVEAPHSSRFDEVNKIAQGYLGGQINVDQIDASKWTSHEFQEFLRYVKSGVTVKQMADLDKKFNFTTSGNSEVLALWLEASVRHEYTVAYPALKNFLGSVGRRKFLIVLYHSMLENPHLLAMAQEIYKVDRKNYHSVSTKTIDAIMLDAEDRAKEEEKKKKLQSGNI
jgi:leukotriene-A4 hydrolase